MNIELGLMAFDEGGPGERIGPPGEVPGEHSPDCPPGHDDKHPGGGDEQDDSPSGDVGEHSGEIVKRMTHLPDSLTACRVTAVVQQVV